MIREEYKSRKFILALLLYIGTTVLGGLGKMAGTEVMAVYLVLGAGYGITNVMDKKNVGKQS